MADESRAHNVKLAVTARNEKGALVENHEPWRWFESLVVGDLFQAKSVEVYLGATLSLQSHHYRSEHRIPVEGIAEVNVNEERRQGADGADRSSNEIILGIR